MRAHAVVLFLALGLALHQPVSAQGLPCPTPDSLAGMGAIVGQVVDAQTQVPLGFATVRVQIPGTDAPLEGRSNASGRFRFCDSQSGAFTISGQLGQLGSFQGPFQLEPGATLELTLELAAAPEGHTTGTLTGKVVDADSGEPIEGATILLTTVGQTAVSNALGNFTFPSLPPGEADLRVNRLGYGEATGRVEISMSRTVHTRVTLSTQPIDLEPITVTATRQRIELPGMEEFERRFHSGWGSFILEDEIQMRNPTKMTDILWDHGVGTVGGGRGIAMRRTGCAPLVYLDDILLTRESRGGGPPDRERRTLPGWYPFGDPNMGPEGEAAWAVNMVHPSEIVAVEVYRGPAETPAQYVDSNSRCGVILIWTRRGNFARR